MKLQAWNPAARRAALRVLEYNPYHGKDGRFTGKSGSASTVAYAGKRPEGIGKGKAAIRREMKAHEDLDRQFPNGPTSRSYQKDSGPTSAAGQLHAAAADRFRDARQALVAGRRKAAGNLYTQASAIRAQAGVGSGRRPEHRERVEQDPKKYTRPTTSGTRPGYVSPRGSTPPLLSQDLLAKRRAGGAAWGHHRNAEDARQTLADRKFAKHNGGGGRERVEQDPGRHTTPGPVRREFGEGNGQPGKRRARQNAKDKRASDVSTHGSQLLAQDARSGRRNNDHEPRIRDMAGARQPGTPDHHRAAILDRYRSAGSRERVPQDPKKFTRPTTSGKLPKEFAGKGGHERMRQAAEAGRWVQAEHGSGGPALNRYMAQSFRMPQSKRAERAEIASRTMAGDRKLHRANIITRSERVRRAHEARRDSHKAAR